ncbi:MAG: hypothetical protein M5U28_10490 [Sandaracinaceae bacterium]|nr:hypothetical protein [Sandaracinaceae bacterium]
MSRVHRRGCGARRLREEVVVKQVLPELARDPRFVSMFVHEAKTLDADGATRTRARVQLGVVDGVYFLSPWSTWRRRSRPSSARPARARHGRAPRRRGLRRAPLRALRASTSCTAT